MSSPKPEAGKASGKGKAPEVTIIEAKSCGNCEWGALLHGSNFISCNPDLPPMVKRSDNPAHYRVHKSYVCILHKEKF
jgi:hypothetical protein